MRNKLLSIKNYFKSKKEKRSKLIFFEKIGDKNSSRDEIFKIFLKF